MKTMRAWMPLAATAFLAAVMGGQISIDPQALVPGAWPIAIFSDPQAAILAHFLLSLPLFVALAIALVKRKVLQVPHPRIAFVAALLGMALLMSLGWSNYRYQSCLALAEWIAYLIAFLATVILAGREEGPKGILAAFASGCGVVAALGLREYAVQPDPTWRIFSNWFHPNALAGLMAMGVFASIGLATLAKERAMTFLSGALAVLCMSALVLTGSKGGLLATGITVLVTIILGFLWLKKAGVRAAAFAVVLPLIGMLLATVLVAKHPKLAGTTGGTSAMSRVANASSTTEQSAGFRQLLWKGELELIKDKPMGYGIGTYRNYSAQPGLTTQTQLGHQSYLQLAVEIGVVGAVLFVVLLGMGAWEGLRSARALSPERNALRLGIFTSLLAVCLHSALDSDFSHFGIGIAAFILLGVLLQTSADATVPEFTPRPVRFVLLGLATITSGVLLFFGVLDLKLGQLRFAIEGRDAVAAAEAFESARSMAPGDPRVWALGAKAASSSEEVLSRLETALKFGPTPTLYRQVSDGYVQGGNPTKGAQLLQTALTLDPNNLYTLRRLFELQSKSNPDDAIRTAQRLVDVEQTPYFKTRSIPELVPTETYEARSFLANQTTDNSRKVELLRPALEGYTQYAIKTVPNLVTYAKAGMDGSMPGESIATATRKLQEADTLRKDYDKANGKADENSTALAKAIDDARALMGTITP